MKKIAVAVLLSSFAAAPAFAENDGGIYVGAKMGSSNVGGSAFGYGVYGGYLVDSDVTSGVTSLSEYTEKLRFAGEVEYTTLGSNSTWGAGFTYATYRASAFGIVLAATYPVNPQFSVIAKAGIARTSYELSCSGCSWGFNTSTVDMRGGVAGQYNLTEQLGLRAGIDSYPDGFTQMSAGAVFQF
jgi:hypothetical protein